MASSLKHGVMIEMVFIRRPEKDLLGNSLSIRGRFSGRFLDEGVPPLPCVFAQNLDNKGEGRQNIERRRVIGKILICGQLTGGGSLFFVPTQGFAALLACDWNEPNDQSLRGAGEISAG